MRFQEWKLSQVRYDSEFSINHIAPKDQPLDMEEIEDNEYYDKRIVLKVLRERALLKEAFDRKIFKSNFAKTFNTDEEVVSFRKRMTTVEREEEEIKEALKKKENDNQRRLIE